MRPLLLVSLGVFILALPLSSEVEQQATSLPEDAGMVRIDDFYIDKYEYPNRKGALPRVDITWAEARALCQKRGKRLCSGSEWEKACKGPRNHLYSYGPAFEQGRCNTPYKEGEIWKRGPGPAPSGRFAGCSNDYGVFDMIGNVWEWTAELYSPPKEWRVIRGGSWFHSVNLARADVRYGRFLGPDYRLDLVGLRCCRSVSEVEPGRE